MSSIYESAAAITTPPPSRKRAEDAAPRVVVHLPVRVDARPLANTGRRGDRLRCDCRLGCSVRVHLRWTPEADEQIDRLIESGFDTSPDGERALIEQIVVADMAASGAREVILRAIDDVPSVRLVAIANTQEEEQEAWQAGAHLVVRAPVDPELLVRLVARCSADLERERLLHDLAEKVRQLREREERRTDSRGQDAGRCMQRAVTMAAFKANLLAETLLAGSDEHSARVQLSREVCASLAQAVSLAILETPARSGPGPLALELRRINDALREGVVDVPSMRRAMSRK